jgi:1,4-dihydroxy-2-naphthoate octaprenyltransferase
MFENRTKKQRIIIYAIIALGVTLLLAIMHFIIQGWILGLVLIVAAIEYVCVFYILYLPLKYEKR